MSNKMELAQVTIQDESGNHAIPCYRGQLNDGRVICVRQECFEDDTQPEDYNPENWISYIDKETIFIEGRYARYGDQEYTISTVTLRAGHPWVQEDWQEELTVAKGTGLGYWLDTHEKYCPTHIASGQALAVTFRTEQQARAYIERMAEYVDWNQNIEYLYTHPIWFNIKQISNRVANAVRRQYPVQLPVEVAS